jgi:hypothetical protein
MASDQWRVGPQPPFSLHEQKQADLRRAYEDRQRARDERAARTRSEYASEFTKIAAVHYLDDEQFKARFAHHLAQNIAERGVDLRQISARDMNGIVERSLEQTHKEEELRRQQQEPAVPDRQQREDMLTDETHVRPKVARDLSLEQVSGSEERLHQSSGHYDALREAEESGRASGREVTAAHSPWHMEKGHDPGPNHLPVEATLKLDALFEVAHNGARASDDEVLVRQQEESAKRQEAELAAR